MEKILKILEKDARTSPETIAAMTGKNLEEVQELIAAAEKKGLIRHYKAVIDWEKAGRESVFAFIDVKVSPARGVGFDDLARRIELFPEVHSVYLVSGDPDLRIVVEVKNIREVASFVAEKLSTIERVLSTSTHFLLKRYKEDGDIFEDQEPDRRLAVTP